MSAVVMDVLMVFAIVATVGVMITFLVLGKKDMNHPEADCFEIPVLAGKVKDIINEMINQDIALLNLNEAESKKREEQKNNLKNAVRGCTYGGQGEKNYLKEYIKEVLQRRLGITEDTIDRCIPFDRPDLLTARERFDILMYLQSKQDYRTAFLKLAEENQWFLPKEREDGYHYIVTAEEVKEAYDSKMPYLGYSDRLEILTYRIYTYFGHGVIDMLRDNAIDGVAGGQSGIAAERYDYRAVLKGAEEQKRYAYDSVWVQAKGIWLHLDFLSFQSSQELERVSRALIKYDAPYELTRNRPKIFTDMKDGSRVTAMRPPLSQTWTFFVRKFESAPRGLENCYSGEGVEQLIGYLKYLVKGSVHIAITGAMGSGKTSLLKELIRYINPTYNIRTSETMFELNVRDILPNRNIVPFRETDTVSMEELVDSLKKTDASCILLGEVSTEELACLSTQLAKITEQQLLTCHPTSTEGLISYFRQALMNRGSFTTEKLATEEVVRSIQIDVHTGKDTETGQRYVEYINEILPTGEIRQLLRFSDGKYELRNAPSEALLQKMRKKLRFKDQAGLMKLLAPVVRYREAA